MKVELLPTHRAAVLTPEAGDDPSELEDRIHDEVMRGREGRPRGERGAVVQVVLDLSGVPNQPVWLKAIGPEVPDCNLRVALGDKGYAVARLLKLDAFFEWYATVEDALSPR